MCTPNVLSNLLQCTLLHETLCDTIYMTCWLIDLYIFIIQYALASMVGRYFRENNTIFTILIGNKCRTVSFFQGFYYIFQNNSFYWMLHPAFLKDFNLHLLFFLNLPSMSLKYCLSKQNLEHYSNFTLLYRVTPS